jgi:ribosomal protein S18 acetylase RimI-like enzyme
MLTAEQAARIAELLNKRNELARQYSGAEILAHARNYQCRLNEDGEVMAFVEVKRVQWYQAEVCHLTVAPEFERRGLAKTLLAQVEAEARAGGVRLLQCTIREGNTASRNLFEGAGFRRVSAFHNGATGNNVDVFQKVLSP